jgi:dinuclear metal center YbgI/SA1388 family protein
VRAGEAVRRIEEFLPPAWAEEWDNPGFLVGSPGAPVGSVAVALDADREAVEAAASMRALLLVHHPPIFRPLRRLLLDDPTVQTLKAALSLDVPILAVHTNWDVAPCGVNRVLADLGGVIDPAPLLPRGGWGLGALGRLRGPMPPAEVARILREAWGLSWLHFAGEPERPVRTLALVGGSGGDLWREALAGGADLFVTADMGYHLRLDAVASGLSVALADHGEMERASLPALAELATRATGLPAELLSLRCGREFWTFKA